ncbi:MAG: tetratricopeptide repeat protein [Burkholderiales bacterium]
MNAKFLVSLLGTLLLVACAPLSLKPVAPQEAAKPSAEAVAASPDAEAKPQDAEAKSQDTANLPKLDLNEQILYEFLLAEVAGQRGHYPLSAEAYLDLAESTRDPRLAERAAEVALFSRRLDLAHRAARLWLDLVPDSVKSQQTMAAVLIAEKKLGEARPILEKLIADNRTREDRGFLGLGDLLAKQPDKQAVLGLVQYLVRPYPDVPEAHFVLAQAAWNAGRHDLALSEIAAALRLRPDWEMAALTQGRLLPSAAESLAFYRAYLQDHPKAADVRLAYARLLIDGKNYAEAQREFHRLMTDFPGNPDVSVAVGLLSLQLEDYAAADVYLQQALAQHYRDPDTVYFYLGQLEESRKQWEQALFWYGKVGEGAQFVPAQVRYAGALAKLGRLDDARKHLQTVAAQHASIAVVLLQAEAQLLREAKQYRAAYDLLDRALKKHPKDLDLLYDHAMLAEKIGRVDVLERDLRKLIQLKPDHAQAYNALGYTLADRGERLDEAQRLIEKALKLAPDDAFSLDSLGWVYYRRGQLAKAEATLLHALSLRPDPEIAAHLGEVQWMEGRHDEAQETWRKALQASPENEPLQAVMKKFYPEGLAGKP